MYDTIRRYGDVYRDAAITCKT